MTEAILYKVGEALVELLERIEITVGATTEPLFRSVIHGWVPPSDDSGRELPRACVMLTDSFNFDIDEREYSALATVANVPILAYFKIDDPEEATKTLYRFIEQFKKKIDCLDLDDLDNDLSCVKVVASSGNIGDIFYQAGYRDKSLQMLHPFYGVRFNVKIRNNDTRF